MFYNRKSVFYESWSSKNICERFDAQVSHSVLYDMDFKNTTYSEKDLKNVKKIC